MTLQFVNQYICSVKENHTSFRFDLRWSSWFPLSPSEIKCVRPDVRVSIRSLETPGTETCYMRLLAFAATTTHLEINASTFVLPAVLLKMICTTARFILKDQRKTYPKRKVMDGTEKKIKCVKEISQTI